MNLTFENLFNIFAISFLTLTAYLTIYVSYKNSKEKKKLKKEYTEAIRESIIEPENQVKRKRLFALGNALYTNYGEDENSIPTLTSDFLSYTEIDSGKRHKLIMADIEQEKSNVIPVDFTKKKRDQGKKAA